MTINGVTLRPCPFCGSQKLEPREEYVNEWISLYFVRCNGCSAMGPLGYTMGHSLERWNKRKGEDE